MPLPNLNVIFATDIERDTCQKLAKALEHGDQFPEVRLIMSSHGGDMEWGLAIYEILKGLSFAENLTTHNVGFVSSAAVLVYLAGTKRVAVEGATWLLHGTSYDGGSWPRLTVQHMANVSDRLRKLDERSKAILNRETSIPDKLIEASYLNDQPIFHFHAREFGLTTEDEVVPFVAARGDHLIVL